MRCLVLIFLGLSAACAKERPGTPPDHILLITLENFRADHSHLWQYPRHTTFIERPDDQRSLDLDYLMERGVLFHSAYAPSGLARPSLGTLFTGLPPRAHGLMSEGGTLRQDVSTLAERLQAAGYQTAGFAVPSRPLEGSGLTRGFDVFVEDHSELVFRDGVPVDGLLMRAFEYLRTEFDPKQPQFLWLHFGSPAPPWEPEAYPTATGVEDFQMRYIDPSYEGPVETNLEFLDTVNRGEVALDAADHEALIALYDGDLERTNFLLRQLLEIYKHHFPQEDAVWERTLVVTAGLSGCELGERGYFGSKQSLHEQGLHVPLAFHHPPSLTGRRILEDLVGLSDVLPTVCEWMGAEVPAELEGRSLLAGVDRGRRLVPRPVVAELPGGLLSARVGGLRVILNRGESERADCYAVAPVELYDVAGDPQELEEIGAERGAEQEEALRVLAEWEQRFEPRN